MTNYIYNVHIVYGASDGHIATKFIQRFRRFSSAKFYISDHVIYRWDDDRDMLNVSYKGLRAVCPHDSEDVWKPVHTSMQRYNNYTYVGPVKNCLNGSLGLNCFGGFIIEPVLFMKIEK